MRDRARAPRKDPAGKRFAQDVVFERFHALRVLSTPDYSSKIERLTALVRARPARLEKTRETRTSIKTFRRNNKRPFSRFYLIIEKIGISREKQTVA